MKPDTEKRIDRLTQIAAGLLASGHYTTDDGTNAIKREDIGSEVVFDACAVLLAIMDHVQDYETDARHYRNTTP